LTRETFFGVLWVPNPTRPRWQPAGSESCVVRGRPRLRSVDSQWIGRVIELRDQKPVRADVVGSTEGSTASSSLPGGAASPESKSRACPQRTPQEPGRPRSLLGNSKEQGGRRREPENPDGVGASTDPVEPMDAPEVPRSEGNEATWDGGRGVGTDRSTADRGEPSRRDPREGRVGRGSGTVVRNDERDTELASHLPGIATGSKPGQGEPKDGVYHPGPSSRLVLAP